MAFFLLLPKGGSPWPYNRMEGKEVGQLDKVANRASIQVDIFLPSSEYEPLPISRSFLSTSKCATQIRHDHMATTDNIVGAHIVFRWDVQGV